MFATSGSPRRPERSVAALRTVGHSRGALGERRDGVHALHVDEAEALSREAPRKTRWVPRGGERRVLAR